MTLSRNSFAAHAGFPVIAAAATMVAALMGPADTAGAASSPLRLAAHFAPGAAIPALEPKTGYTLSVVHSFGSTPDGANPSPMIQDKKGNLYGTTEWGGVVCNDIGYTCGAVFKIDPKGNESLVYAFAGGNDGANPVAGLAEDKAGNVYGVTQGNGKVPASSTVFKIDPSGHETVLNDFSGPDACCANTTPVIDDAGDVFGTSPVDGNPDCVDDDEGCGSVYEVSSTGQLTLVYAFSGSDGFRPVGGLVRDGSGNLYGVTALGGVSCSHDTAGCGVVFRLTSEGSETLLHAFTGGKDGATPLGVMRDKAGDLFGIAQSGGDTTCFAPFGCGTIFEISAAGKFKTLYTFNSSNTRSPVYNSQLLRDSKGDLYGTKEADGANNSGYLFRLAHGKLSDLFDFPVTGGPDGSDPNGLVMGPSGKFYGSMLTGGTDNCELGCGTVYELTR